MIPAEASKTRLPSRAVLPSRALPASLPPRRVRSSSGRSTPCAVERFHAGFNPKGRLHQLFQPRRGSRLPGPYGRAGPEQRGGHVSPPSHRAGHGHIPRPLSRIGKAGNRLQERGEGVSLRQAVSPQFRAQRRRHIPPQMQDPVVEQIQKLLKCRVPRPASAPAPARPHAAATAHPCPPAQADSHQGAEPRPPGRPRRRTTPAGMLSEAGTPQSMRPFHASRIAPACQTSKRHGADRKRDRASPSRSAEARRIAEAICATSLYGYRFSAQAA